MLLALRIYIGLKLVVASFAIVAIETSSISLASAPKIDLLKFAYIFVFLYSSAQFFILSRYKYPLKKITFLFFALDISFIITVSYLLDYDAPSIPFLVYVCVAASSMILRLRLGLSLAIFTIILIIVDKKLSAFHRQTDVDYSLLGVQIVGILFSCYFMALLARRAHYAEIKQVEEKERSKALININHELIQELDTGIIVIDNNGSIETYNTAASALYSKEHSNIHTLRQLDPELHFNWLDWSSNHKNTNHRARINNVKQGVTIDAVFSPLGSTGEFSKITLLTESVLRDQAQRYSLERMGRMATAIAHEIRNPLTSITTANELLAQHNLSDKSKKISIDVIKRNSIRINQIIKDVLSIAQSKQADMEKFDLHKWLTTDFLPNYYESNPELSQSLCSIKFNEYHDLSVQFSKPHLTQILSNLLDNAVRHGDINQPTPIVIKLTTENHNTTLEVFNMGETISKENSDKIFEPFFTTKGKSGGTGLGLYLCQQICELNLATLNHNRYRGGNGFTIEFQTNDPLSSTI